MGKGTNHPMLYRSSLSVKASKMNWIAGVPPPEITDQLNVLRKRRSRIRTSQSIVLKKSTIGNSDTRGNSDNDSLSDSGLECTTDEEGDVIVGYSCECRVRYQQSLEICTVTVSLPPQPTSTSQMSLGSDRKSHFSSDIINHGEINDGHIFPNSRRNENENKIEDEDYDLVVTLSRGVRAATPGQILAFYSGDECLGGGIAS